VADTGTVISSGSRSPYGTRQERAVRSAAPRCCLQGCHPARCRAARASGFACPRRPVRLHGFTASRLHAPPHPSRPPPGGPQGGPCTNTNYGTPRSPTTPRTAPTPRCCSPGPGTPPCAPSSATPAPAPEALARPGPRPSRQTTRPLATHPAAERTALPQFVPLSSSRGGAWAAAVMGFGTSCLSAAWIGLRLAYGNRRVRGVGTPTGCHVVLSDEVARRSARTVNRMLKAVVGFYEFHGRRGTILPGSGRSGAQRLGSATAASAAGL